MTEIKILKGDRTINILEFSKRSEIKKTNIQELFKEYYNNSSYKFLCSCVENKIINMNLAKQLNFINIKSSPNNAHLHNFDCIFNAKIIEIQETCYSSEEDRYTINIFNIYIENKILNLDTTLEEDKTNFTIRLSHEKDIDTKDNATSRKYIRYKNYKDFCLMILEKTLLKMNQNLEIEEDSFLRRIRGNILYEEIMIKGEKGILKNYIDEHNKLPKNKNNKYFIKVEICNQEELKKLRGKCLSQSVIQFIDKLILSNECPVLCIYFEENFKVKVFFASLIKIHAKSVIDKEAKLREEALKNEKNRLNILLEEEKQELIKLKKEDESFQSLNYYLNKNDEIEEEINQLKKELWEKEKEKDKFFFIIKNNNKELKKTEIKNKIKKTLERKQKNEEKIAQKNMIQKNIEISNTGINTIKEKIKKNNSEYFSIKTIKSVNMIDIDNLIKQNKFNFDL